VVAVAGPDGVGHGGSCWRTYVCFAVRCSSLGTFGSRFTELIGVPLSTYRRQAVGGGGGAALVRGQAGDQTDRDQAGQESRSTGPEPQLE
jgi:hypothetical protein